MLYFICLHNVLRHFNLTEVLVFFCYLNFACTVNLHLCLLSYQLLCSVALAGMNKVGRNSV